MTTTTDVDVLTNEWVKKIHFENRVDLNLQLPAAGESGKIEIPELPLFDNKLGAIEMPGTTTQHDTSNNTATTTATTDSYLNAIVSSSKSPSTTNNGPAAATTTSGSGGCTETADCTCYKCQRQKRRARGTAAHNKTAPELTRKKSTATLPVPSTTTPPTPTPQQQQQQQQQQQVSPTVAIVSKNLQTKGRAATLPPTSTPNKDVQQTRTVKPNNNNNNKRQNSICRRKTPSVKSYDKHLPRPTYSAQDSIYRLNSGSPTSTNLKKSDSQQSSVQSSSDQSSITTTQSNVQDGYQISWKDDTTGDDLLDSLKTFQHIFEQQPTESTTGLSDLLEVGAHEMKRKRQEQQMVQSVSRPVEEENEPPPGQLFTLKYRKGPNHRALTLYHTMKMKGPQERMAAYGVAFNHCIRANSGLYGFIQRQTKREMPKPIQEYTPRQPRRPTKKSILRPMIPGKKQKATADDMWHKISSSENPAPALPPSNPWNKEDDSTITPTDVLSAAHALLPNQSPVALHDSLSRTNVAAKPYDHVDTPSKPIPNRAGSVRETGSISSMSVDGESSKASKSGKLFSSFGRKSSTSRSRSGTITSTQSRSDSIKKKTSMQRINSKGSKDPRQ